MRTTKRFTPTVLGRFAKEGRGEGVFESYKGWHGVTRGDPSSRGRSHILRWRGRQIDLLSDGELVAALFSMQVPGIFDLREQFPLNQHAGAHELMPYVSTSADMSFAGTQELAEQLDIRHPAIGAKMDRVSWVMTTDQLLTVKSDQLQLLAVSCKPSGDLSKRSRQLLALEQAYWAIRGVQWLLITPEVYDPRVGLTLRRILPWSLSEACSNSQRELATRIAHEMVGLPRFLAIKRIGQELGCVDLGQRAFWQSVYYGKIPMDLSTGWRPYETLNLLSEKAFWAQNPIVSRRSAWN
nr:TnsA endonuclease N-terminal domain-containing protein [uncultured Deefgea sp.]